MWNYIYEKFQIINHVTRDTSESILDTEVPYWSKYSCQAVIPAPVKILQYRLQFDLRLEVLEVLQ